MSRTHLDQRNNLAILEKRINYSFKNRNHLIQALLHSSYNSVHGNYQRYEFLGDSILNFIIGEYIFKLRGKYNEGQLTRVRAKLVCEASLARIASDLEFGRFLFLGPGELKTGGEHRPSSLADAFEAIIAAIYLDSGSIDITKEKLIAIFNPYFEELSQIDSLKKDSKSILQEMLQARKHDLPKYSIISLTGEHHKQKFKVACQVKSLGLVSKGEASSRRIAEQEAAREMTLLIRNHKEFKD